VLHTFTAPVSAAGSRSAASSAILPATSTARLLKRRKRSKERRRDEKLDIAGDYVVLYAFARRTDGGSRSPGAVGIQPATSTERRNTGKQRVRGLRRSLQNGSSRSGDGAVQVHRRRRQGPAGGRPHRGHQKATSTGPQRRWRRGRLKVKWH
jgi:hypothetical protein